MPFPYADFQRGESIGAVTGSSLGTTITAGGSANAKAASYTQLIASTAFPSQWLYIMLNSPSGNARDFMVDVAVGAASSESNIISNLFAGSGNPTSFGGSHFIFPIAIPAGTRVSARCQSSTGSSTLSINCITYGGGFGLGTPFQKADTYGANTTDTTGESIDPGGTANTEGSWTQITASTTRPHYFLALALAPQRNTVMTTATWLFDIAIGAGGSEVIIHNNICVQAHANIDMVVPSAINLLPCSIPAGTRIAVRSRCSINDATDRLLDVVLYGIG